MHDRVLSPVERGVLKAQDIARQVEAAEHDEQRQIEASEDAALMRAAMATSYRRGRAILTWCDEHAELVAGDALPLIEQLRWSMMAGEPIADRMVEVMLWVPQCIHLPMKQVA